MTLLEDIIAKLFADADEIEDQTGYIKDPKIQYWIKEGMKLMTAAGEALQNAVNLDEEAEE